MVLLQYHSFVFNCSIPSLVFFSGDPTVTLHKHLAFMGFQFPSIVDMNNVNYDILFHFFYNDCYEYFALFMYLDLHMYIYIFFTERNKRSIVMGRPTQHVCHADAEAMAGT